MPWSSQGGPGRSSLAWYFSCRMRFLSSLLKSRRLTVAYSFMKALALPRLMVKVRPLCSRGFANVVEEGVPDSDVIVLHVRAGSGLFSRSARNSSHFFWPASSESLRVAAHASRCSARLSATVGRRKFRFLLPLEAPRWTRAWCIDLP